MIYTEADGKKYWLNKEKLKAFNERDHRVRMPANAREGFIEIAGACALIKRSIPKVEQYAKKTGMHKCLMGAFNLLSSYVHRQISRVTAEQVCALQNNTRGMSVTFSASVKPCTWCLSEGTVQGLVDAIRHGVRDEHGEQHCCRDCMICMERNNWQRCDLYLLLNGIPIMDGLTQDTLDQTVCPYALASEQMMKEENQV